MMHRSLLAATFALLLTGCAFVPGGPRRDAPAPTAANPEAREPIPAGATLWIVDGREVDADAAQRIARDEVASVEVLKGRAAVARYGARAANGAVVVRTRGRT